MEMLPVLEEIGFKAIESRIYLHLLAKGAMSQQKLSDDTSILRQTVYEVMSRMETKGFVSSALFGKRKIYSAVEPQALLQKLKEKEECFLQILPKLENMKSIEKQEIVSESFVGAQGLKNLFSLTLLSKSDLLWFANEKYHIDLFKDYYWENYALKRAEKKIPIKLLIESNTHLYLWTSSKKDLREVRASKIVNEQESSFVLFDDKIILYSLQGTKLFGVFIQNKNLKKMFESVFMNFWNNSKIV